MISPLILLLFLISGAATGWLGFDLLPEWLLEKTAEIENRRFFITGLSGLIGLIAGFAFQEIRKKLLENFRNVPSDLLISRAVGLILGLLAANLVLAPILLIPLPWEAGLIKPMIAILSNIFFGLIGYNLAEVHGRNLLRLFNPNSAEALLISEGILTPASAKILDTSVIIDGRINGLISSGLLEGQIIVAQTVINELQQLADSSNNEKRAKGRRGLKLLRELRETYGRRLVLNSTKYDGPGTDDRLLSLTSDTGGTLITTDFNLSQIARVQELKVLNLSELLIALQPDVQPGQKLNLKIVREGKEENQGIAYLEDGTMVVIENAKNSIGQKLQVEITGSLQTPSGRMIFGKLEKDPPPHKSNKTKATQSNPS